MRDHNPLAMSVDDQYNHAAPESLVTKEDTHPANLRISNLDDSNLDDSNLSISNLDISNLDISNLDISISNMNILAHAQCRLSAGAQDSIMQDMFIVYSVLSDNNRF